MITHFAGALFDSMDLMQRSDVFIGMHGAGWTNALFLSKVTLDDQHMFTCHTFNAMFSLVHGALQINNCTHISH